MIKSTHIYFTFVFLWFRWRAVSLILLITCTQVRRGFFDPCYLSTCTQVSGRIWTGVISCVLLTSVPIVHTEVSILQLDCTGHREKERIRHPRTVVDITLECMTSMWHSNQFQQTSSGQITQPIFECFVQTCMCTLHGNANHIWKCLWFFFVAISWHFTQILLPVQSVTQTYFKAIFWEISEIL